jgi:hypothetical protein
MASNYTRAGFTAKVADMVGRSLSGTSRSNVTTQTLLNDIYEWAQLRLSRAYLFPELDVLDTTTCDTTNAVQSYTFTTLFGASARINQVMSVVIEDTLSSVKLKRTLFREMFSRYPYPAGESVRKPVFYYQIATALYFFPVPDVTYDIHIVYSKMPTRATGDSSYSDYTDKDDVIIAAMMIEYFNYLQEKEESTYWEAVYKNKIKEAVQSIIIPTDWEPEGRAFNSSVLTPGDFWKSPLTFSNP